MLKTGLEQMGGSKAEDLLDDNFSWNHFEEIKGNTEFAENSIKGILGSLIKKSLVGKETEDNKTCYFLEEKGINHLIILGS